MNDVFFVALASAIAAVALFSVFSSLSRREKGETYALPGARLRQMMSMATMSTTTLQSRAKVLERVAPSPLGFLPVRVPEFIFGNILDGYVQIADQVPHHYAKEDTLLFRSWLEQRLRELFPAEERGQLDHALRSLDGEAQRSLLVPLVFLAHAHRWGCTSPPQWVLDEGVVRKKTGKTEWKLPEEIALALDDVRSAVGGIQRTGSVSLLFLRNWKLIRGGKEGEDVPLPGQEYSLSNLSQETLRPRFSFCSREMNNDCEDDLEAAEASVLHSVVLTEAAASRLPPALLSLFDSSEEAERAEAEEARAKHRGDSRAARDASSRADAAAGEAAAAAATVSDALREALSCFHEVFRTSKISTIAWSRHIQPFYCALTCPEKEEGGAGEEQTEGGEQDDDVVGGEEEEHGVGGAQIPWVHLTDALFGIASDDPLGNLITRNRPCLLPEERLFVSFVEAHSLKVRRWLSKGFPRSEVARSHWNKALSTLVAWRATHRARAAAYLVPVGMGPDAPSRGTTGGTATYNRKKTKGAEKRRSESESSGDENARPPSTSTTTPVSVLSPSRQLEEQEQEELQIRASFNALMDGRIARTRASSIDGSKGKVVAAGVGTSMSDLFPSAS